MSEEVRETRERVERESRERERDFCLSKTEAEYYYKCNRRANLSPFSVLSNFLDLPFPFQLNPSLKFVLNLVFCLFLFRFSLWTEIV